jgi:hypothetical protein
MNTTHFTCFCFFVVFISILLLQAKILSVLSTDTVKTERAFGPHVRSVISPV